MWMDQDAALSSFAAIDEKRCRDMLDALIKTGASEDTLRSLVPPLSEANEKTRDLIRALTVPAPAPEPRILFHDDFGRYDPVKWDMYGAGNNSTWGQGEGRTGLYTTQANAFGVGGLTMTSTRAIGTQAMSGKQAWFCGFMTTRGKSVMPLEAYFEVRARFDTTPGFWPAPLWLRSSPGGAGTAESDLCEWFGNDPKLVRQATHLRSDTTGKTSFNVVPKYLGRPHSFSINDLSGWHTYGVKIQRSGSGLSFTYSIDGTKTCEFSTDELASKGVPHDNWIDTCKGWDMAICTQTEGVSGSFPADVTGPLEMQVDYVKVTEV